MYFDNFADMAILGTLLAAVFGDFALFLSKSTKIGQ